MCQPVDEHRITGDWLLLDAVPSPHVTDVGDRGLFDAAISQRDRKQRDKWRILAKPDGMFAGIFQYSNHLLRGPQSEDDIPLPFIVADYGSGPCHGQFRSQSLSKVANQPWFLPENQGDPSMQIHSVKIDICMMHNCPISTSCILML